MGGALKLELIDVYGDFLDEPVDIIIQNQTLDDFRRIIHQKASRALSVTGLNCGAQGLYQVTVEPMSFHPVSYFVRVPHQRHATVPILPGAVNCAAMEHEF